MPRVLKIVGIVAAVLAGLLVLVIVVINLIPGETYKSLISSGVKSATGRELAIEGDLDISLSTSLGIQASGIKFSNADWGSRAHMVSVDRIEGNLALFPLLRGILDVSLIIDKPDVQIETSNSGQGNWHFGQPAEEESEAAEGAGVTKESEEGGGLPIRPRIRKLHINGTRFAFLDGKSGDQINVQSEKLHIGSADDELSIELKGMYNDIPLAFTGGFGNAEVFVDNQPAGLKLVGHFGDAKLVVQGTAGPLAPTFDLAVTVGLNADSVAAFTSLAGRDLPDIGPLSVSAKLTGKDGKYAVSDMVTTLEDKTLMAEAKGSIADLTALTGLKLEAKVDTGNLTQVLEAVGFKSKYPLPDSLNATVMAEGNLKELTVKQFQTKIEGQGVNLDATAKVKNIMTLAGVSADFSLETDSLDLVEEITKTELPPFGPLKATANIVSKGENLGLMEIKATLNGKIIHADVAGSIGDPLNLKDVNANVNLGVDSLAWLVDFIKMELPPLGSLKASANIVSKGETFEIKDLKANLDGENITAKVAGSVGDLLKVQGIDATVDLGVQSLAFVSDYIKMDLPPLGPLRASAGIVSKGDTFEAKDINVDLTGDKIHAKVAGSVGDLLKAKEINAHLDLGIESLSILSKVAKTDLPPLGPLSVSASIASKGDTFEMKDIKAKIAGEKIQAKIAASVADVLKLAGINANIDFTVDSLASIGALVKQELPASGPVTLEGKITSEGGLEAPTNITAMVKSDGVTASLTGSIAEPLAAKGIDLALTVEAESMQKVGKLTGSQLQGKDPLKLEGKFTAKDNTYELAGLHFEAGELDVKGKAAFTQPLEAGGRPRISGELHVGDLDISKRHAAKRKKAGAEIKNEPDTEEEVEAEKKDKVFSSEPLPFGPLKAVDVDLGFTVESLTTQELNLENLTAKLTLDNGFLSLEPLNARIGDGTLVGTAVLDARNSPAALKADIEMKDATFRNFGGKLHFLVDLEGSGNSIAAIMASLDGQLMFNVKEATLKKSFMTGFGTSLLDTLNPFDKEKEDTELICAIALFDIKEGVADAKNTIAAQMADVTWFGSGEINLMTEEIGFGMHPKPRKGLGISMGSLAKVVAVGGTLVHPRIVLDPKDIAVKYGKYTAAMATGGLTLAADLLFSRIKANTDVCANILEELDQLQEDDEKAEKEKSE